MRKLSVLLICLLSGLFAWLDAPAQEPTAGVIFFQHRQFKIPFNHDYRNVNIKEVRLYVSSDQGRSWKFTATAAPEEKHFRFSTPVDGFFWFAVQTVDSQGKLFPPSVEECRPELKVIVDTNPPLVQAQPLPPRGGEVGVAWSVRDDNLDLGLPGAVEVQYRVAGGVTWIPLAVVPGSQQHYWNPQTNAAIEVRVAARDRAGNVGEHKTTVSLNGAGVVAGGNAMFQNPIAGTPPNDGFQPPRDIERKFVNSKQISLSYDLRDVGPSGVSSVELWYMFYSGKAWNKLTEYPIDLKNGAEVPAAKKLTFEVPDEGIYGISLVAKSGVGLGERPPQVGEKPQFWIEVDLTKPVVQILGVTVGSGQDKGKVSVNWNARDRNLGALPIRLSYSEQRDGPWTPCAEKLANLGRYIWTLPEQVPYQFYVRVEAVDSAGNVGEAITLDKVKVDLSLPKAKILDITPGGN